MEQVTILHMSDTHLLLSSEVAKKFPSADILIHTGDFTNMGTAEELEAFNRFLGEISPKYQYRVIVYGNHDCYRIQDNYNEMKQALSNATHVLTHEQIEIKGLSIYGSPWWFGHTWDYYPQISHKPKTNFDMIPNNVDILLTHGPARYILDEANGVAGEFSGSAELRYYIDERKPKLHLFGHIHEQYGIHKSSETLFVNSAMKNKWGNHRIQNFPHYIVAKRESPKHAFSFHLGNY